MNYPKPPPDTIRARLNTWLEHPAFHPWLSRMSSAILAAGLLFGAFLVWAVGSLQRPSSEDGLAPPAGDIQYYVAIGAAAACTVAAGVAFAHAATGRLKRTVWITLAIALMTSAIWRILLLLFCPDC